MCLAYGRNPSNGNCWLDERHLNCVNAFADVFEYLKYLLVYDFIDHVDNDS